MTEQHRETSKRRPWALAALVALVVLLHAWITHGVMAHMQELGGDGASQIKRMDVDLVAEMALTEPPVAVAPPPPAPAPVAEAAKPAPTPASAASKPKNKPAKPASSPQAASSASQAAEPASAPASEATTAVAAASSPSAPEAANPIAAEKAASGPAFEWPQATRVTFKVEGYLRGPIYGNAQVEWVRQDMRYQVHIDASLGPSFAPLGSRRWTSEGIITERGLAPQKFESIDKLLIKSAAPKIVTFEETEVVLPSGERVTKLPGVQDAASHYIQLAYRFILNPALLKVGSTVELPVAHTKRQEPVIYDILAEETLDTPLGKVDTFKLKPRKLTGQKEDILAEIWIAPGLQYLPIRMLVRQGEKNFLDMQMDRRPQQTSATASDAAARAASGAEARVPK
jgi:hypothetical protein